MHSKNFLSLFAVLTAAAHLPVRDSAPSPRLDVAASNNNATPRNAVYSTLWKDPTLKGLGPHTPLLPLVQHNSTVTHVYLFNLEVKSNGSTFLNNVTYNSHHYDWLLNETKTLQSKGVKVMASAGGAGASIWPGLEDKFDFYYSRIVKAVKYFNLDGLDLDIETPIKMNTTLKLLQQLNDDFGPKFILTIAPVQQTFYEGPQGLSGDMNYTTLDRLATAPNKPKLIDWYNAQFYSGGAPDQKVGGLSNMEAYEKIIKAGFEPERIVMTIATYHFDHDPNQGYTDWWPITGWQKQISKIVAKYGNRFGGVAGFEYFNAGLNDHNLERWEWVRDIGDVLYGNSTGDA